MIGYIIKKIVGSKNDREVRKLRPMVAQINEIEAALQPKPEEYLREKTAEWKTVAPPSRTRTNCARAG